MDLPDREVDAAYFDLYSVKLLVKHGEEVINLSFEMVLKTLLADLLMDTLVEPFHNSILDLTNALQVGKVFLKFVAIWSHAL